MITGHLLCETTEDFIINGHQSVGKVTVTRPRLQIVQEEVVNVSAAGNRSAADVRDAFSWQCTERATVHFGRSLTSDLFVT